MKKEIARRPKTDYCKTFVAILLGITGGIALAEYLKRKEEEERRITMNHIIDGMLLIILLFLICLSIFYYLSFFKGQILIPA